MFDVSVLITTVCRSSLLRAVDSVFSQSFKGSVQVFIGVDVDPDGRLSYLREQIKLIQPSNFQVDWLTLPYSTSRRHGGPHECFFGGSLRTALSFLANSEVVLYLDDDDWLHPNHLKEIMDAISDFDWAYSYCFYADGGSGTPYCVDEWESVGVGRGVFLDTEGGFVRPSGLAIRKMNFLPYLHLWSMSPSPKGDAEDRLIFRALKNMRGKCTEAATVFYSLDPKDAMHPFRLKFMDSKGVLCNISTKEGSARLEEISDVFERSRSVVRPRVKMLFLARLLLLFMFFVLLISLWFFV